MAHSYKTYLETKDFMKKFVNATEGSIIYGISKTHLMVLAKDAGATSEACVWKSWVKLTRGFLEGKHCP